MSLSIIIPVFNEVKLLPQILRKVIQATPLIDKEIIIKKIKNHATSTYSRKGGYKDKT